MIASRSSENISRRSLLAESIEDIARAAVLAPSHDNCQPWRFWSDGKTLEIRVLPEKAAGFLNVKNAGTWISLGATLANIEVAAAQHGLKTVEHLVFSKSPEGLVAHLEFQPREKRGHPLYSSLPYRCTNRKAYESSPLSGSVHAELMAAVDQPGAYLNLVESAPDKSRVGAAAAAFDELLMENRDIHDLIFKWVRWTPEEILRKKDGLPVDSVELDPMSRLGIRCTASWRGAQLLTKLGCSRLLSRRARKVYCRSAALGLISLAGSGPEDFVKAGKVLEKVWLLSTLRGLSFQPLAGAVMLALQLRLDDANRLPPRHRAMAERIREKISAVLPAFEERVPAILFRVGKAAAPSARAPRFPLHEVFSWENKQGEAQ